MFIVAFMLNNRNLLLQAFEVNVFLLPLGDPRVLEVTVTCRDQRSGLQLFRGAHCANFIVALSQGRLYASEDFRKANCELRTQIRGHTSIKGKS